MGDILNQAGNILNCGGSRGTIIWFSVALIATICYVCAGRHVIKGCMIASYVCLAISFFKAGISFQAVVFAVIILIFGMVSSDKKKGTKNNG